jgi:hypothetical protein
MHIRIQTYLIRRRHNKAVTVVVMYITVDFVYLVSLPYLLLYKDPLYLLLHKDLFLCSPSFLDFVTATAATA